LERFSYKPSLSRRALELCGRYPEVKAWYDEISVLKSPRTAQDYVDALAGFLEGAGGGPSQLLELSAKEAHGLMRDWAINEMRSRTTSTGRVHAIWYGVKSFLKFHGIDVRGEFPLKHKVKYLDKIPTREELKLILDAAPSLPTKIAIQLMAYAGLRPEDICDLTYASIKGDFEKGISPCAVYVPQSKGESVYVTFIPEETLSLLKQYFKLRKERGEEITDSSPILRGQKSGRGIRRKTLTMKIENAMRRSGVNLSSNLGDKVQRMRPYGLRKYFRSNLTGHAPNEYIEAWLGHTTGLEHVYGGTRDLDPSTIERMREAYKKCEPFLSATMQPLDQTSVVKEAKVEALKSIAKSLLSIDLLEVKIARERELGRELSKDEELILFENELKRLREGTHNPQRIVSEEELEDHLAEGWQFVSVLPSRRILIRKV